MLRGTFGASPQAIAETRPETAAAIWTARTTAVSEVEAG